MHQTPSLSVEVGVAKETRVFLSWLHLDAA